MMDSRRGWSWPLAGIASVMLALASGVTAAAAAAAPAAGAYCQNWTGTQPPSPGNSDDSLDSVTVVSACDAWAVGIQMSAARTLIEHWNGHSWTVVPSPSPGTRLNELRGVRGRAPG